MSLSCVHCNQNDSHAPGCTIAVSEAQFRRQKAADQAQNQLQFVHKHDTVMQGARAVARAVSKNMAKRIANALNHHKVNSEGV
jgi:ADP-ribosylglycohydrolase